METVEEKANENIVEEKRSEETLEKETSQAKPVSKDRGELHATGSGEFGADFDAQSGVGTVSSSTSSKNLVNTYQVRPNLGRRFRPVAVNELIHDILHEELTGKIYSIEESEELTTKIATFIRDRVKEMAEDRYKYMVQVVLAEQRGAGIVMGMRCLWDAETDSYASNQFISDTIYGMAAVFAVYFY